MKNFYILLLFITSVLAAAAQKKESTSSNRGNAGDTTLAGLPLHNTYVPQHAVEKAKKIYRRSLYSIGKTTLSDCQEAYVVGLIRNSKLTMELMCADLKVVLRYLRTDHIYYSSLTLNAKRLCIADLQNE